MHPWIHRPSATATNVMARAGAPFMAMCALMLLGAPSIAAAQQPAAPARTAVDVVVYDSLANRPLAGATVQLVLANDPVAFSRTGETDSVGRFTFWDIPAGRYSLGFMHPLLDTLGITAPVREVQVETTRPMRADLAVPPAQRLRVAFCGAGAADDSTSVLLGTVREPRNHMPLAGAEVTAQWLEVTFGADGIRQRVAGTAATTREGGWFSLCGVPSGTVTLRLRHETDSATTLDLQVTPGELRRRDLYVAAAGTAELSGRVIAGDSTARALGGARVTIEGAGQALTDAAGRWTIDDVPLGTRMLEVRAIGYYPERRPVDVVAESASVEVALTTFQAVLDAVRVTATRDVTADLGGFAARQRGSGMGRFLSADQIMRRNPIRTSDLLRTLPGFIGDGSLAMKGNFSDGSGSFDVNCTPEVYVDGQIMRGISATELDALVEPEHIAGIEVYSAGSPRPPQFDMGMSGCGALVIWQKPASQRRRR